MVQRAVKVLAVLIATLLVFTPTANAKTTITKTDKDLLAHVVYAEARNESLRGQIAVVAVILNRLESPLFPKTIRKIIYQKNAFSCVKDGQIKLKPDDTAHKAVEYALKGVDPTRGSVFFWNPEISRSGWMKTRKITRKIGNHVFAN